jgi:hypothetical protein
MLGCYDFCGHYEWTFEWLRQLGGESLVREYWDKAIFQDSQSHASELILKNGIPGMESYWGHTLAHEGAGYHTTSTGKVFRIDIHDCPSKGFLIRNKLAQYHDYCDHCIGWIGPMMKEGGFVIDHEHNHCGQCWWEVRRVDDHSPPSSAGELSGESDVRCQENWVQPEPPDSFLRSNDPDDKAL